MRNINNRACPMCGSLTEVCVGEDTCTPCFIVWTLKASRFRILVDRENLYQASSVSFDSIVNCGSETRSRKNWYRLTGGGLVPMYEEYGLVNFCILVEWIRDNPNRVLESGWAGFCQSASNLVQASRDEVTSRVLGLLGMSIADEALIDGVWHCLLTGEPDSSPVVVISADLISTAHRTCTDAILEDRLDIDGFLCSLESVAPLLAKNDWVLLISLDRRNSESPFYTLNARTTYQNDHQLDIPF